MKSKTTKKQTGRELIRLQIYLLNGWKREKIGGYTNEIQVFRKFQGEWEDSMGNGRWQDTEIEIPNSRSLKFPRKQSAKREKKLLGVIVTFCT